MAANTAAERALFNWDSRSVTGAPVPSLEGPVIDVSSEGWQRDPCADLVLVLADKDPLACLPMGLRGFLGVAARSGATLGGAGGGVAVLAQLGFLNGHSAVLDAGLRTLAPDGWPLVATARGDHALDRRRLTATGGAGPGRCAAGLDRAGCHTATGRPNRSAPGPFRRAGAAGQAPARPRPGAGPDAGADGRAAGQACSDRSSV